MIRARTQHGLTQSQLAAKSGVSLSAIKGYESGRNLPGARELRELCQALETSPNKLLFGTEVPFKERSFADVLLDSENEDEHVVRARATVLLGLLAYDERKSLLTLVKALALARHGESKVREAMTAADLLVGVSREMIAMTSDATKKGTDMDMSGTAERLDEFMGRQGNVASPEQNGLPKK